MSAGRGRGSGNSSPTKQAGQRNTERGHGRVRTSPDVAAWLATKPSLDELCEAYPADWETVQHDVSAVAARGSTGDLAAYAAALSRPTSRRPPGHRRDVDQEVRAQVRRQMTAALIRQLAVSAATGVKSGRVRFNLLDGYVAQKLLFARDLDRKPVSLPWFRLVWPLVRQRRLLMPLVNKKGIYCFYSRPLLTELTRLIDGRLCLEIAAGDGTLARMLRGRGIDVTATDDHSWDAVRFADDVEKCDATTALRRHQPEVVLCSWPPGGNTFERNVFTTNSVQLYVVISSRHEFAAGDWTAYRRQRTFDFAEDETLSRLVLPPELDSAVYVFHRR